MKKLLTLILLGAATSAFGANLYTGASVGYLVDSKEAYFTGRIGYDIAKTNTLIHSVEAEIGYMSDTEYGATLDITPLMANYRLTGPISSSKFSFYAGGGIGSTRAKLKYASYRDSSWAFTAQGFGGVEYALTPTVSVSAGGRYLWIGDATLGSVSDQLGDDFSWEVGIRFKF